MTVIGAAASASHNPVIDNTDDADLFADFDGDWRDAAKFALKYGQHSLTAFEVNFCRNVAGDSHAPSDKQMQILRAATDKVLAARARAA